MIPTKEQFIQLNSALGRDMQIIACPQDYTSKWTPDYSRIDTREREKQKELLEVLSKVQTLPENSPGEEIKKFLEIEVQRVIKPDVESYLEKSATSQQLFAWKWLHSQENFAKAKGRLFRRWPSEEQLGNGLERYIAEYAVDFFIRRIEEKQQLVSKGVEYAPKTHEALMVNRDPSEIFQSALRYAGRWAVRYRRWVAGVIIALSNYHYGKTSEMAVNRKNRVGALIAAWENLNEQIALSQSDPELGEYLQRSILALVDNRKLNALRALHQNGTLYFVGRADETVSERLFIRELALLHRELFYKKLCTSAILDLFYLEGMKSAPTERAIQRVAKSAVANWVEKGRVESEAQKLLRHKIERNGSTTV